MSMRAVRLMDQNIHYAKQEIINHHYTHSIPSGKSYYFQWGDAIVVFSIPANKNIASFLLWKGAVVWELTRLWAPNAHEPELLTQAISASVASFKYWEPTVPALVSYADPNFGHLGGVYRAASWIYTGQSEETRSYIDGDGNIYARRAFHSGKSFLRKQEILDCGFTELKLEGKHRFAKGLTRYARKVLCRKFRN